jgi:uncharacterized protein YjiS (DUF1127 family)
MSLMTLSVTAIRSRRVLKWSELRAVFIEWHQRSASRYELTLLDDRELWDVGLTRMDASNEAAKPFWRGRSRRA